MRTEELTVWKRQAEEEETKGCKAVEVKDEPNLMGLRKPEFSLTYQKRMAWCGKKEAGVGGA